MSIGTSDTTIISSIKTGAHNLNPTSASAPLRDGPSPANPCGSAAENCRIVSLLVVGNRMYTFASEMVVIIVVTALSLASRATVASKAVEEEKMLSWPYYM